MLVATLAVGACVPSGHLAREQATAPDFDPIAFFAGHTEGRGTLAIILRHRQPTLVEGHGFVGTNDTIVLNQDVRRGSGAVSHRQWRLRRVAPRRYAGTLSDAIGPVKGSVAGNCLHLSFRMKGGLEAQQWLYLQSGGQTARNRMLVKKLGLTVASLDETIVRMSS